MWMSAISTPVNKYALLPQLQPAWFYPRTCLAVVRSSYATSWPLVLLLNSYVTLSGVFKLCCLNFLICGARWLGGLGAHSTCFEQCPVCNKCSVRIAPHAGHLLPTAMIFSQPGPAHYCVVMALCRFLTGFPQTERHSPVLGPEPYNVCF